MIYVLFDCAVKPNRSFGALLRGSSLCFRTIGNVATMLVDWWPQAI